MDGARGEEDALLCDHEHPVALQPVPEHGGISWWESFYIFGANVQF